MSRTTWQVDSYDDVDYWGHLSGTLIRWDCPEECAKLWISVIVRALCDGYMTTGELGRSRTDFLWSDEREEFGLWWIADHLSNNSELFVAYWRRADREAWNIKKRPKQRMAVSSVVR